MEAEVSKLTPRRTLVHRLVPLAITPRRSPRLLAKRLADAIREHVASCFTTRRTRSIVRTYACTVQRNECSILSNTSHHVWSSNF